MSLVKLRPTSPGKRGVVRVVQTDLYKGEPFRQLTEKQNKTAGRNNSGKITIRHRGGGHKQHYRKIDFQPHPQQ
jgi:large subunit ribosomal protein L2